MPTVSQLEPRAVFHWFEALSGIPRGSRNTKAVSDWCAAFARGRGLPCTQDAAYNVIISAPASPGYEDAEPLIIQGHLDMVCEKTAGNPIDMETEPLRLIVDGNYLHADGTTLGGDDGIAVAMALAVLDDTSLPHPPLEVVLTTEEEIGMLGAAALDTAPLKGRRMLNLDSETEGVFTVSCAGGAVVYASLPVARKPGRRPEDGGDTLLRVTLSGLTGGHSGTEIHHGRANACNALGKLLREVYEAGVSFRLVRVDGGLKDNAIPVACTAELATSDAGTLRKRLWEYGVALQEEFRSTDPDLEVTVQELERTELAPMDTFSTARILQLLTKLPAGVQSMSADIPNLVQTSLNLGILSTEADAVKAVVSVRSSAPEEKAALIQKVSDEITSLEGTSAVEGDYPAWEYRADSPLRKLCEEVFREQYGKEPKIEAIHAGLECGLFCGKLPGLDCVSLGPDLLDIHTPRERMNIPSVGRVWAFLLEVLKRAR